MFGISRSIRFYPYTNVWKEEYERRNPVVAIV